MCLLRLLRLLKLEASRPPKTAVWTTAHVVSLKEEEEEETTTTTTT